MNFQIILVAACAVTVQCYTDDSYMHKEVKRSPSLRGVGGEVEPPEFWQQSAQQALNFKLNQQIRVGKAKNLIMFLGDGWGVPTLTASRILKSQARDNATFGEEGSLHLDTFPHTGTSRTFCSDAQVADSACSATAYLCGVKANEGTAGVSSAVLRHNCTAQNNEAHHVSSILAWAQAAGMSTGVVTTTRITHASPSGTYAHIANRDWESDVDVSSRGEDSNTCSDIAEQLILANPGKDINVILGGGRRKFLPENVTDSEGTKGERKDGQNLVDIWKNNRQGSSASYVETDAELMAIDSSKTDYLLGLFNADHIEYYHEQAANKDPTLTDMTQKAIEILSKNPKGFFLFVEGGRIDHAHHDNYAYRSLWEAVEFDRAIQKGDEMTDDNDSLIVVTADHSHAFSLPGYPDRGSLMTDIAGYGNDGLPYTSLSYANGPGFRDFVNNTRHNVSEDDHHSLTYRQVPLVPLGSETHGGEDVMIFAKGPFSHLFTGTQMQSYIPHAMAYSACIGVGTTYCGNNPSANEKYM